MLAANANTRPGQRPAVAPLRVTIRGEVALAPAALLGVVRHALRGWNPGRFGLAVRVDGRRVAFPAKLVGPVLDALDRANLPVTFRFRGHVRPPACDPARLGPADAVVAALLRGNPEAAVFGGLVEGGVPADALVPGLLRAYPAARAVVVAATRRDAADWAARLRDAAVPQPVTTAAGLAAGWSYRPKAVVATPRELDHCRREDFDLLVAPDPAAALAPGRRESPVPGPGLTLCWARRLDVPAFGIAPAGGFAPEYRCWAGAVFGPALAAPPRAAVRVVAAPAPPPVRPGDDGLWRPLERRATVWADAAWAEGVAVVATLVRARDPVAMAAFGLTPADCRSVAVLVEADPHPRLLGRLGGWAACGGFRFPGSDAPLPAAAVVSENWAAAAPTFGPGVLIDARCAGPLRLPGFPPPAAGTGRVTVIDLAGHPDPRAGRAARDRLAGYRRRGWAVATAAGV